MSSYASLSWLIQKIQAMFQGQTLYVGLLNSNLQEPTQGGYQRAAVQFTSFGSGQDSAGGYRYALAYNTSAVTFVQSKSAWFPANDPAVYWAVFSHQGGGNMLFRATLDHPTKVNVLTQVTFPSRSLVVSLSDEERT